MAAKVLGKVDLTATTDTSVYQVPTNFESSFNVSICNRNASIVNVRIALVTGAITAVTVADYLLYDFQIAANSSFQITGLVSEASVSVMAYSDTANVSVQAYGYEDSTI